MKSKDMECTSGQMGEYSKVIGNKIKCMGQVQLLGLMDVNLQEYLKYLLNNFRNILMIKNMGKAFLNGQMVESIKDNG